MSDIIYIAEHLSCEELLCQLAEECAELSHAALKLRRVISGKNPTPVSRAGAHDAFLEEMGDVRAVMSVILVGMCGSAERGTVAEVTGKKIIRWVQRIEEAESS